MNDKIIINEKLAVSDCIPCEPVLFTQRTLKDVKLSEIFPFLVIVEAQNKLNINKIKEYNKALDLINFSQNWN